MSVLIELKAQLAEAGAPGGVVGWRLGSAHECVAWGATNVDHPLPVTPETLFQVGSITKTFTATLALRLVELGALDLDAPVHRYAPGFRVADPRATARVTLRHLLTHSAGWVGDFFHDTGYGDDAQARFVRLMADLPQLAPLGTHVSYNNAGFNVLGHVIEQVVGRPYEEALREHVLEPLGLRETFFWPGDVLVRRFAVGHTVVDGVASVATPWGVPRATWPVGGIVCSAGDLLRYAGLHLGDRAADPLSAVAARLRAPQIAIGGWHDAVGLGWWINQIGNVTTISHGGGTKGQVSLLTIAPEQEFACCVLTNGSTGGRVAAALTRLLLRELLGVERPLPVSVPASSADQAELCGLYSRPYAEFDLRPDGDRFTLHLRIKQAFPDPSAPLPPPTPPIPFALLPTGDLLGLDHPYRHEQAQVIRDGAGAIRYIRLGGRLHPRAEGFSAHPPVN